MTTRESIAVLKAFNKARFPAITRVIERMEAIEDYQDELKKKVSNDNKPKEPKP